jgi:DNA-directed RNA polymerase sigma subunit (sigma70/sigma32)
MVWFATADRSVKAESGLTRYLRDIRRFPMLERREEYMLAKRWRRGDREAAHKLVTAPRRQDRHGLSRLRPADL